MEGREGHLEHPMACVHPEYGQKITLQQRATLFGEDHATDFRGIVQRDGKVSWIHVQTGAHQTYPNDVSRECIKYCFSKDNKANLAMKRANQITDCFLVKVVPDKSTETFLWGKGKVNGWEDFEHNGRMFRRFIIERVCDADDAPCDVQNKRRKVEEKQFENLCDAEPLPPPLPPPPPPPPPTPSTPSSPETSPLAAAEALVEGWDFDSRLERHHAIMLSLLNIEWSRVAPTVHGIKIGSGRTVSYTPDFLAYVASGSDRRRTACLIEIKPRYPYDDEIRKAMGACASLRAIPVFLFYNTEFKSPFADAWHGQGHGNYDHHEGIRALKFSWNEAEKKVDLHHDAGYTMTVGADGDMLGGIDVRQHVGDSRFSCPQLLKLYDAVEEYKTAHG
jgi:hypothetical protein